MVVVDLDTDTALATVEGSRRPYDLTGLAEGQLVVAVFTFNGGEVPELGLVEEDIDWLCDSFLSHRLLQVSLCLVSNVDRRPILNSGDPRDDTWIGASRQVVKA